MSSGNAALPISFGSLTRRAKSCVKPLSANLISPWFPVCREGEAIAVAVGLMLGGKEPVVVHQNTGFFESGDSVRSLALDLHLPLLLLIGYRGWKHGAPMTDSAAIFTEPILDAWGIKYYLVETDEDVEKISLGYKEARETQKTVVILLGGGCEHLD